MFLRLYSTAIATMHIIKQRKKKGQLWSSNIKELMSACKDADAKWKQASKLDSPHPLEQTRKICRTNLRSATVHVLKVQSMKKSP